MQYLPVFIFQENSAIEAINLMCNDFGKDGAEALAKALHVSLPQTQ